ncbi:MAG: CotH kinase family protein [Bacteroidota bacterium]|nr:CotH kinase family protein [Bacteroidota bacterium]
MFNAGGSELKGPLVLLAGMVLFLLLGAAVEENRVSRYSPSGSAPSIFPEKALIGVGDKIIVNSANGGELLIREGATEKQLGSASPYPIKAAPDHINASRILAIPLAMQWRHPEAGLPAAQVISAAEIDALGRMGPERTRTYLFQGHGDLPVISLNADHTALFDADSGIMVIGNAMLHAEHSVTAAYARDASWWKYPGNFMGRGGKWERDAQIEMITPAGELALVADARIRINGQMTRGFPQHALRLKFDDPIHPWNPFEKGLGYRSMVLRAAGNDQVKAMMRDAFQQTLCAGLHFETSKAWPCVLYVNGAYWGVHHLRERIDEKEIARRYSVSEKEITILEDAAVLYHGDPVHVMEFKKLINALEKGAAIDRAIDTDGFLTYMASQMILGNMDWPEHNVKYWRYTGERGEGVRDGRWYWMMGDSDLSFGANAAASSDLFIRVRTSNAPISMLFRGLMRDRKYEAVFRAKIEFLLEDHLSSGKMLAGIDRMVSLIGPEMERHTARWRRPRNKATWEAEVELMREFARTRASHVRQQLIGAEVPGSLAP